MGRTVGGNVGWREAGALGYALPLGVPHGAAMIITFFFFLWSIRFTTAGEDLQP